MDYKTEIQKIKREIERVRLIKTLVDKQIEDLEISIEDMKREELQNE